MIKAFTHSVYFHLINFLRIKQAVFFSLAFPVFLFVVFGNIWGINSDRYVISLFTGVLGMTIASDGLFAIGPVIREYYASGIIKYLRRLPINVLTYFIGLIISRIMSLLLVLGVLIIVSRLMFGYSPAMSDLPHLVTGIVVGLFTFSFVGLCLSFSGVKNGNEKGLVNLAFFTVLFTSNAFYPVDMLNGIIGMIGSFLPLNPVLALLRGEEIHPLCSLWLVIPMILFSILFRKIKFAR
ncbi:ABC transporter permease [Marinifilum flexuosum]|uniref:ABC transporter permease n=1 Tax=Marinifilum flexuosum TaxID=1117708 RepID=UPI0024949DBD|nr:ABC transporter permease [Marinifilum flexuosum]